MERFRHEKMKYLLTRRDFVKAAGIAMAGIGAGACRKLSELNPLASSARVSIFHAASYEKDLVDILKRGLQEYNLNLKGKRVVLKPNLVEYHSSRSINTNPAIIQAAIEAFRSAGAGEVIVAEGPGHQRDTEMLLELSGLDDVIKQSKVKFVDLNTDSVHQVKTASSFTTMGELWLPDTVLGADLLVSMPKMKTHHWAGVTLSLKNMFGIIPSVHYGWPKNKLHWHGINESIADITTTVKPGFTIIDGIEGMQGNGPLHGDKVDSQVIVMSDNLAAADATAARLMNLNPERVVHLNYLRQLGEPIIERRIKQIGETVSSYQKDFQVIESFAHLKV